MIDFLASSPQELWETIKRHQQILKELSTIDQIQENMNQRNSNPVTKNQIYHSSSNPLASHPPAVRRAAGTPICGTGIRCSAIDPTSFAANEVLARLQAKEDAANKDGTGDRMGGWGTWGPGDDDPILQLPLDIGLFLGCFFLDEDKKHQTIGVQNCILHT